MSSRWIANKFGLFNFWYYDEEEYKLSNGKVIFRGTNGSGKSVTTQSFIPLLLDGDKRPHRIDPFGTKSRKIENYILMNEEEDDRISYLYMEFKKPESKTYITIGIGFRARRGKNLESWYFILKDGRRVNKELKLYKFSGEKLPLTDKQLKNELGEGNVFTSSQKEYMAKVNEHLFGYSDIENYKELLNLLIELRSPKLSKDFKPTKIYGILNNSLNTLSDEDLRDIAEAMDNMDMLNNKLEVFNRSLESATRINRVYCRYNQSVIYKKALQYNKAKVRVSSEEGRIKELTEGSKDIKDTQLEVKGNLEKLNTVLEEAKTKKITLEKHQGFEVKEQLEKLISEIKELAQTLSQKRKNQEDKLQRKSNFEKVIEEKDYAIYKLEEEVKDLLGDEEYYAEKAYYDPIVEIKKEVNNIEEDSFDLLLDNIKNYNSLISSIYGFIIELSSVKKDLDNVALEESNKEREVRSLEKKLEEAKDLLTTSKIEYIESINRYLEECKELKIDDSTINALFKKIHNINEIYEGREISLDIKEFSENIATKYKEENIKLNNVITNKSMEIDEEKSKLENLEKQKENIQDSEEDKIIKEVLEENKIPYLEFYKCYSFNEDVDENMRVKLEGALYDMNILKSLIVPKEHKNKVNEILEGKSYKVLFADNRDEKDNISKYFTLEDCEFNKSYEDEVKSILSSISINNSKVNSTSINLNYSYTLGIIEGGSSSDYALKYIGVESRRKYIEMQKELILKKIKAINEEKELMKESVNIIERNIKTLYKEVESFPKTNDIEAGITIINEAEKKLEIVEGQLSGIRENLSKIALKKNELEANIIREGEYVKIPRNKEDYKEALEAIDSYKEVINKLKNKFNNKKSIIKEINNIKENIEELEADIDIIVNDIYILKEKDKIANIQKNSLEDALKSLNLGEIEEELTRVVKITQSYPKEIEKLKEEVIRLDYEVRDKEKNIEYSKIKLKEKEELLKYCNKIFDDEYSLKYVQEAREYEKEEAVMKILATYNKEALGDKEKIAKSLYEITSKYNSELVDYNMKNDDIFTDYEKSYDEKINELLNSARRVDIVFKVSKRSITLMELIDYLNAIIEENKMLINNEEREVFENTLINTLSSKISAKIHNASKWVRQINKLMSFMDTSNGLKLDLKWIPKKSENVGELGGRELTNILSEAQFTNEEEREKLALHFKERLKKEKRLAKDEDSAKSYLAIIKEVLDYRQWYEFKLSYSNNKMTRLNELTDNEFFKLSGGEKAMAMYIPLFAAVNARYNAADKKDCPRIIALDEAFAGVDEQNISLMFNLLEGLDLDYVLNSQVLWGTYESVKSLAIYELIRQGEEVILPIKYSWDGKVKTVEGVNI